MNRTFIKNVLGLSLVLSALGIGQMARAENLSLRLQIGTGRTGVTIEPTHAEAGSFAVTPRRDVGKGASWRLLSRDAKGRVVHEVDVPDVLQLHLEGFDPKTGAIIEGKTVQQSSGVMEVSIPYGPDVASVEVLKSNGRIMPGAMAAASPLAKFNRAAIGNVLIKSKAARLNSMAANATLAVAPTVVNLVRSGPSAQRFDIVLVGDGYDASQIDKDKWIADAGAIAETIYRDPLFQTGVNIRRVDVVSNQTGIDEPENGIWRDTAFHGHFNCQNILRSICVDDNIVYSTVGQVVPPDARDFIIVVANSTRYGGSATYGGTARVSSWVNPMIAGQVALHELGHSAFLLADEYVDTGNYCHTTEPASVNVTRDRSRTSPKWGSRIASSTPIPTPAGMPAETIGMFEGASMCATGIYRSTFTSKMKAADKDWYPVNEAQVRSVISKYYSPCPSSTYTYLPSDPTYGPVCKAVLYESGADGATCRDTPWASTVQELRASGWTVVATTCRAYATVRYELFVKPRWL